MLIILDGWGVTSIENQSVSAIAKAYTPFIDFCIKNYPNSKLNASGKYVGLPNKQVGNSEVGHINIGSGRRVIQSLKKINISIKNGFFTKKINNIFKNISYNKKIHFIGLLSDGGVHSHINHLLYLLKIFHENNLKNVFIHAFMDGRDTSPYNGIHYIKKLLTITNKYVGQLSSVIGRFYAMDRNLKWDRTKIAYDAMVNSKGTYTNNIINSIENFYKMKKTDEFLSPLIMIDKNNQPISKIENGDIVFCFNYRSDRSRQITELLTNNNFEIKNYNNINLSHYITMTSFNEKYKNIISIFEKENLSNTLGEILSKEGKKQIRIAETEKYPHITFFFSGGREKPFDKEVRILCPSPNVKTYDIKPEMSAIKIVKKIIPKIKKKEFDFICINFANPDMVGHTGNMIQTIKACEIVDKCVKECSNVALHNMYTVIIVGDHGNADYMINTNGSLNTSHSNSLVPFILLDNNIKKNNIILNKNSSLCDIAPTILNLMKLPVPDDMNGFSIINRNNNN